MDRRRTIIGVVLTVLYLGVVVILSWSGRAALFQMDPNEVGDFLAGIFGPLAVLWLILGYFQQGEELRHSTDALRQQAEELRQSVEHQEALVHATREQVRVQLAAVQREQEMGRAALRPKFTLRASGQMASGLVTELTFRLENIGHRASDIEVSCSLLNREIRPSQIHSLNSGAQVDLRLVNLAQTDVGECVLMLKYKDGGDEICYLNFPITIIKVTHGVTAAIGNQYIPTDC